MDALIGFPVCRRCPGRGRDPAALSGSVPSAHRGGADASESV